MPPINKPRRHCLQLLGGAAAWATRRDAASAPFIEPQAVGQLAAWPQGKVTPNLHALAMNGQTRSLTSYAGAPLILNFWASYCAPCRLEMPQFNQLLSQYQPQGLRVAAVNHGEMPARVLQFLQTVPFNGDVLLDRSQTQLPTWGGVALPTSFVIDSQGRVRFWHVGEIDWLSASVQAKLQTVLRDTREPPLARLTATNA